MPSAIGAGEVPHSGPSHRDWTRVCYAACAVVRSYSGAVFIILCAVPHGMCIRMYVHILPCGYVFFMAFGAGQDLGQQIALNDLAGVSQKWNLSRRS